MDLGLKDKKALVVGASRGLGAAIARTLALEGATVFAAARSVDKIEAWIAELPADARGRVSALRLDTGDLAQVDAACETLLAQGGVDILVNNTGGPPPGVAAEVKRDAWITQFQGMAANLFHLTQRLLPPMRERKWGRVITVASSGIEQPIPNLALSNGIRSAVLGWSKTLAAEVAADGVTVNMVLPGRIETERLGQLDKANAERQNVPVEKIAEASRAAIPAGRYGTPQEFANVVAFLAGEPASYVTGSKIRIDGGATRSV
jgi:3-oxoacyl-[acyl-carrier protein] reductase